MTSVTTSFHVMQDKTCLHHAVHEGYNMMVTLLLQHNPDVTAKDQKVCFNGRNSLSHIQDTVPITVLQSDWICRHQQQAVGS